MWFREYTFNLIIQPFHLLLYTVMVGSAMSLAAVSLPYAVVAIYFVIPGEKLLRKFFGFDNAGTLSAAGSFAGGALFSAMINKMNRPKPPHEKDKDDKPKVRKPSAGNRITSDALQVETSGGAGRQHWWKPVLECGGLVGGSGGRCRSELVAQEAGAGRSWRLRRPELEALVTNFRMELAIML